VARKLDASVAPARRCAYDVVRRVWERGEFADRALQAHAADLAGRDRALAMRLSYGCVQRMRTLDHFIARLAERPPQRLDAPILAALRLGLYELCYLGGAPDRAVVDDCVELAKHAARAGHGLVNAVLRRAAREGSPALLAELRDDTPEQAALMHSHPDWIARAWFAQLGDEDARALMAAGNEPSELALRANTLVIDAPTLVQELTRHRESASSPSSKNAAGGVRAHLDAALSEAVVLEGRFDVHRSPLWRSGACIAQSRAAMRVARVLAPAPGERVLDVCAAPGGKTTHLAALMGARGELVALERSPARAEELTRTVRRMRAANARVELGDAAEPRPPGERYDRVLVDPPCSGLGTLAARPDLRWRVTPRDVEEMARKQLAILSASAHALRPGGVLVYATCTISRPENEHVIAEFLDSHADFTVDDLAVELPAYALRDAAGRGFALTLPHRDRTAGFFIARLRRS
jgi:16S rRNA (cytosine967-C5)-methyltransferase